MAESRKIRVKPIGAIARNMIRIDGKTEMKRCVITSQLGTQSFDKVRNCQADFIRTVFLDEVRALDGDL